MFENAYVSHEIERRQLINLVLPYIRNNEVVLGIVKGGLSIGIQFIPDILIITSIRVIILKRRISGSKLYSTLLNEVTKVEDDQKSINIHTVHKEIFYFFPIYPEKDIKEVVFIIDRQKKTFETRDVDI